MLNTTSLELGKYEVLYLNFSSYYQNDNRNYSILIDSSNSCRVAITDRFYSYEWLYTLETNLPEKLVKLSEAFLSDPKYLEIFPRFNMSGQRPHDDMVIVECRPSSVNSQISINLEFGEFNRMENDEYANRFLGLLRAFRNFLCKMYDEINVVHTEYGAVKKCYIKGAEKDLNKLYAQFSFQFNTKNETI